MRKIVLLTLVLFGVAFTSGQAMAHGGSVAIAATCPNKFVSWSRCFRERLKLHSWVLSLDPTVSAAQSLLSGTLGTVVGTQSTATQTSRMALDVIKKDYFAGTPPMPIQTNDIANESFQVEQGAIQPLPGSGDALHMFSSFAWLNDVDRTNPTEVMNSLITRLMVAGDGQRRPTVTDRAILDNDRRKAAIELGLFAVGVSSSIFEQLNNENGGVMKMLAASDALLEGLTVDSDTIEIQRALASMQNSYAQLLVIQAEAVAAGIMFDAAHNILNTNAVIDPREVAQCQ
ncbi:MAG: hypothetical protein FWF01_01230 [Alphaproteobacteria bacterium]|nr:hypothetical protein [Alphaproteobacteria bacterium]